MKKKIALLSRSLAEGAGNPKSLVAALAVVVLWGFAGPVLGFTDTWQLFINTTTTIITFLLAISIQITQNRDAKALHMKLNKILSHYEDIEEALEQIEKRLEDD